MLVTLGIVIVAAVAWVTITTLWLWRNQERVAYQPPAHVPEAPARARRVDYPAADGHRLYGFVVEPRGRSSAGTVVIAFHGNADLAAWTVPWAVELVERTGAVVFVPEYRGYGGIAGEPTHRALADDAQGALRFARERLSPSRLVLFGHSLGTAIAVETAKAAMPNGPDALILQSPFTSARDMATRMLVPTVDFVWNRISRLPYDTRAAVASIPAVVHVAHGTRDLNIPARMGRAVYASARNPGDLLIVDGAGHNDVPEAGGERYWRWIGDAVSGR